MVELLVISLRVTVTRSSRVAARMPSFTNGFSTLKTEIFLNPTALFLLLLHRWANSSVSVVGVLPIPSFPPTFAIMVGAPPISLLTPRFFRFFVSLPILLQIVIRSPPLFRV